MPRKACQYEGCVREATCVAPDDPTHDRALCTPHRTAVRQALRQSPDQVEIVRDAAEDARPQRVVLRAPQA